MPADPIPCPACGAENRDDASFCGECGAPLRPSVAVCGACGRENSPDGRFCDGCGNPLREAPMRAAPDPRASNAERRTVSVLFADAEASTELGDRLDAEE